ncbi:MAG: GNAT family N-acetyltransferase [Steroidobacteraceae bacterium]
MLDIRPSCECCDTDLPPESPLARICSFECTFCATCAERHLNGKCPNCGGELLPRPRRPASGLAANPASTVRVFKPDGCKPTSGPDPARGPAFQSEAVVVRRVAVGETSLIGPLGDLLIDAVHSGASVGFLAPVARATADRYWQGIFAALGAGDDVLLWVAEAQGKVVGSVQLALCPKENGRHRAEVQKLFVHTAARGKGLSTLLMQAVEAEARTRQRSLLVLDTLLASHAETVYRHLGWSRAGEIPDFATSPDGELFPTVYYFKQLGA